MTDLKPCPFCNKPPKIHPKGWPECGCMTTPTVNEWNTRPIEDRLRAALGNLLKALDVCDHSLLGDEELVAAREALK